MNTDSFYYREFKKSLRPDQIKDYDSYSINNQKDWYIRFLESNYCAKTKEKQTP
jgi:hypothetical protein